MKSNEKVVIGWIDPGTVYSGFAAYIIQLAMHRSDRISNIVCASGSYLSANRNNMVRSFLQTDGDWLLSLDSDLLIDIESFDNLIKAADSDKYPIIGGKYFIPLQDSIVLAAQKPHPEVVGGGTWLTEYNKNIVDGLHSIGAGYMLVHRKVFEAIQKMSPHPMPWFQDYWDDFPYDSWISDDIHFFKKVKEHNFNVALCTTATSTHLKTSRVSEDTYIQTNKFIDHDKKTNHYGQQKRSSWFLRGKNK